MTTTPIYALTEWGAAQATPWVPHNIALRALEAAARGMVADRDLFDAPGACVDGACYLIDAGTTGGDPWDGHTGKMAVAVGANAVNGWILLTIATEGQILWVDDENLRIQYTSGAWSAFPDVTSLLAVTLTASEAIAAGDFVHIWDDAGTPKVQLADGTNPLKFANGYAPAAAAAAAPCQALPLAGLNSAVSPAATGEVWLSVTVPGGYQTAAPATTGQLIQSLGSGVQGVGIYLQPGTRFEAP